MFLGGGDSFMQPFLTAFLIEVLSDMITRESSSLKGSVCVQFLTHMKLFFFMAVIVLNGIFKYLCEVIFLFHLLSDLWIIEIIVGYIYSFTVL